MSIPVKRVKRKAMIGDPQSPEYYYLKPVAGHVRSRTLDDLAHDIQLIGSMSVDDVSHVVRSLIRRMKVVLTDGDSVKIPGLGTFFLTFNCIGTEQEKDCTVKNIRKVNIRFRTDNTLRLTNDSTSSTRGGENNVSFYIKGETDRDSSGGGNNSGGGDDGGWVAPSA